MILRKRHTLDHCLKFHGKRQNNKLCDTKDLRSLRCRSCKNRFPFSSETCDISKKNNAACHYKINYKIPEVCPLEHSKENSRQNNMRHKKLFFPERFLFYISIPVPVFSVSAKPGIQNSQDQKDKHDIYHMGMKISQNKRITWKFVNGFIRHIRIMANIPGRVRKPVAVHIFSPGKLLDPRNDLTVHNIVHISGYRYAKPCCHSCCCRNIFFLPGKIFLQPVHTHLIDNRKRQNKRKSSHKGTHQIISKLHLTSCQLCEKHGKILSAVIIINMPFAVP